MRKKRRADPYPETRIELEENNALTGQYCYYVSGLSQILPETQCKIYANNKEFRIITLTGNQQTYILDMSQITNYEHYKRKIPKFPISGAELLFTFIYKGNQVVFRFSGPIKMSFMNGKINSYCNFHDFMKKHVSEKNSDSTVYI